MQYVRINDILEYPIESAYIIDGDLYVTLDMSFQEASNIFEDVKKIELLSGENRAVVGNYAAVEYISTTFGGGTTEEEIKETNSKAKDVATVRMHVLTKVERVLKELMETQLEQDIAIAELYGGSRQ